MSAERTAALLLGLYPPAWRARYGAELEELILETSGGRVPWRVRLDVAAAAARERLRGTGMLGDGSPEQRMRGGVLSVLCAWALFVVGGAIVQKFSEHWQAATPATGRAAATDAFDVLLGGAVAGACLVLAGVAAALPGIAEFVRCGGLAAVRRPVRVALWTTGLAVGASVAVVVWAHRLTVAQRNGHDLAYAVAVVAWGVLCVDCLVSWTVVAVAVGRRLRLSAAVLRLESFLAAAVALAMLVTAGATVAWWARLASVAPWFLAGRAAGSSASPFAPALILAATLMAIAAGSGVLGAGRALRAAGRRS